MSNGLKLILIAAGTLITCFVVTVAIHMARASNKTSQAYTDRVNEVYKDIDSEDITSYDGIIVYGSDVVNFIKKHLGSYQSGETSDLTITVVTVRMPYTSYSYVNSTEFESIQNFTNHRYINPLHTFQGAVKYNSNDVIVEVTFTVQ